MKKIFLFGAVFLSLAASAMACPMCKESAASADPKLTQGFDRSIKLLLITPYLVFGGMTFAIVRAARRKKS